MAPKAHHGMANDQAPMTNKELPLRWQWSLGLGHWGLVIGHFMKKDWPAAPFYKS
jgi:hypothetical protein